MTILLVQIFVLLLGAFLLGAGTACLFRRAFSRKKVAVAPAQPAAAAHLAVPSSDDRARFVRALSGDQTAIVPPPFQATKPVPVIEVQPAPFAPQAVEPLATPAPVVEVTPPFQATDERTKSEPSYTEVALASSASQRSREDVREESRPFEEPLQPASLAGSSPQSAFVAPEPAPGPVERQPSYTEIALAAAAAAELAARAAASQPEADGGPADDLTRIHSIDRALEQKLNQLGVYRFAQIAEWAASDIARISQTLGFYGRIEQENWIEQAREFARSAAVEPISPQPAPEVASEAAEQTVAGPLQSIIGIDRATEQVLVAHGVTRISDIAQWNWQDVDRIEALLGAPGRIGRERWVEQARVLERGEEARDPNPAAEEIAAPAADPLHRVIGIDPTTERLLIANGITRIADIAQWNWQDVDRIEALLGAPGRIGRERWVEQARVLERGEEGPGEDAAGSADADRLDRIIGIDRATEQLLVAHGVTRVSDIAQWNWQDVDRIEALLGAPGRIGRERWVEQARVLERGEEARDPNPAAEEIVVPAADPLHRIIGIDPTTERLLIANGITRIADIAQWNWQDVDRVEALLGMPGRVEREKWIEQARIIARGTQPQGVPQDVTAKAPAPVDQLHRIIGIDPATEQLLVVHGIKGISDIAQWNWQDVDRIEALLGTPGRVQRERWIEQARFLASGETEPSQPSESSAPAVAPELESQSDASLAPPGPEPTEREERETSDPATLRSDYAALRSVRSEALLGDEAASIYVSGQVDDLKRVRGIGVLIEKKLNSLGITSYEQIANWTSADVERISGILDFKGRIERENWIEQARILASGGQTEFSRRVDR